LTFAPQVAKEDRYPIATSGLHSMGKPWNPSPAQVITQPQGDSHMAQQTKADRSAAAKKGAAGGVKKVAQAVAKRAS
jgi:hypothetical protein